jgi:hypothetical protein
LSRARSALLAAALLLGAPALLAAGVPAPARAQSATTFVVGVPSGKVLAQINVPGRVQGQLVVSFHGDSAAGCATWGLCAYSGTIVVHPQSADLVVVKYRGHGRIRQQAEFSLQSGNSGFLTVDQVQRSIPGQPAGECADAPATGGLSDATTTVHGNSISIAVLNPGDSVLTTRCAGPLEADVAGAGPGATISLAAALRGHATIHLSGTHSFATHGFAGTVSSTLVVRLGKPQREPQNPPLPPRIGIRRERIVFEALRLTGVGGRVSEDVLGSTDPVVCRLLDSCGAAGTLTVAPLLTPGATAEIAATGPASRPYRDFLTALGLSRAGQASGISVGGAIALPSGGEVTADFTAPSACTDTATDGDLFVEGEKSRGVLRMSGGSSSWRTRCPGPLVGEQQQLLSGAVPISALARRTSTVVLHASGSLVDDGYSASLHGRLELHLRRGRISQHVLVEPAP